MRAGTPEAAPTPTFRAATGDAPASAMIDASKDASLRQLRRRVHARSRGASNRVRRVGLSPVT
ncbi:MAG: hypothetical protein IT479_02300 [Xanthomonadales bacterium]|nr:hypothetical protein [Xanthomonadales bacterium]MCE7931081.1 hypothetical protein [Xanthomonadales bacterium PRO6]